MVGVGQSLQEILGGTCQLASMDGSSAFAADVAAKASDAMGVGVKMPKAASEGLRTSFNQSMAGLETGAANMAYAAGTKPEMDADMGQSGLTNTASFDIA